ncbi:hypothetical protein BGK67_32370 [Streptomyces subrutilus]|uniref:Uncharacterized protein n=1 Tax=Streptomyces subrutilus TaxID=36818 RepID=A0A1E5NZM5_9ACTN|nr:hypothetical protein BGK67_32370 [Streptomyces subrutilus]
MPEPDRLPLTPDELERHGSEWGGAVFTAPPADSYADPLAPAGLPTGPPLLRQPPLGFQPFAPAPGGPTQDALKIAPAVLTTAAGKADEIHTAFTKSAAALEEPARTASTAMTGWESADALKVAHKQWEKQAGTVAGWLAHISESLRIAARDYNKTNADVDHSFRGVSRRSQLDGL